MHVRLVTLPYRGVICRLNNTHTLIYQFICKPLFNYQYQSHLRLFNYFMIRYEYIFDTLRHGHILTTKQCLLRHVHKSRKVTLRYTKFLIIILYITLCVILFNPFCINNALSLFIRVEQYHDVIFFNTHIC